MASNATTCGFRLESIYRKHLNRFFPQLRYFSKKRQQRFFSNFFGQPFPFLNNHFSVKCTLSSTVQDEVKRKTVWLKSPFHSIKFSAIQIFPEMDAMILQFFFHITRLLAPLIISFRTLLVDLEWRCILMQLYYFYWK